MLAVRAFTIRGPSCQITTSCRLCWLLNALRFIRVAGNIQRVKPGPACFTPPHVPASAPLHPWARREDLAPRAGGLLSSPLDTWGDAGQQVCLRPRGPRRGIHSSASAGGLAPAASMEVAPCHGQRPSLDRQDGGELPCCPFSGPGGKKPVAPSVLVCDTLWGNAKNHWVHSGRGSVITRG